MTIDEMQKIAYKNSKNTVFKNPAFEFCLLYKEIIDTYESWRIRESTVDRKIADAVVHLLLIAQALHLDFANVVITRIETEILQGYKQALNRNANTVDLANTSSENYKELILGEDVSMDISSLLGFNDTFIIYGIPDRLSSFVGINTLLLKEYADSRPVAKVKIKATETSVPFSNLYYKLCDQTGEVERILLDFNEECDLYTGFLVEREDSLVDNRRNTMTMREMQKLAYEYRLGKGHDRTDINKEFCLLYGKVAEAYNTLKKCGPNADERIADIAISLMGIAEIFEIDLQKEIERKMRVKEGSGYTEIDEELPDNLNNDSYYKEVWGEAKAQMERKCISLSFNTWIAPLEILKIDDIDKRVELLWPNENKGLIRHINDYYLNDLEECLSNILGEAYKVKIV